MPALHITSGIPACLPTLGALAALQGFTSDSDHDIWHLHVPQTGSISLHDGETELFSLPAPQRVSALADALAHALQRWQQRPVPLAAGWELSPARRACVHPAHGGIGLTDKEYALLLMLWQASGGTIDRDTLLSRIWAYESGVDSHTLETHLYRLRGKCGQLTGLHIDIRAENEGYALINTPQSATTAAS